MKDELVDKVKDLGVGAAQLQAGVGRVKEAVADAVEDGIDTAKRTVKQGGHSAEDLFDHAEHHVKKHPLTTLGISFGMGLGLGDAVTRNLACAQRRTGVPRGREAPSGLLFQPALIHPCNKRSV